MLEPNNSFAFANEFQSEPKSIKLKLGELLELAELATQEALQAEIKEAKVKELVKKLEEDKQLFSFPEVLEDEYGNYHLVAGRHRVKALLQLMLNHDFTEVQAKDQYVICWHHKGSRVEVPLRVLRANETRNPTPAERVVPAHHPLFGKLHDMSDMTILQAVTASNLTKKKIIENVVYIYRDALEELDHPFGSVCTMLGTACKETPQLNTKTEIITNWGLFMALVKEAVNNYSKYHKLGVTEAAKGNTTSIYSTGTSIGGKFLLKHVQSSFYRAA